MKIIQQEVFLKTSIDNIDFFAKKSTRTSSLYKSMLELFINNLQKDWRWQTIFVLHKIYRKNFHRLLICLPFITQTAVDYTISRTLMCPQYLRVFKQRHKHLSMNCPHYLLSTSFEETDIGIYCRVSMKKPKHLERLGEDWGVVRKYGVLTKQKYKDFYVKNPDVHEVLVYEEVAQRDLLYYAYFVDKIMTQYLGRKENKN
jgi:hypothetical protein